MSINNKDACRIACGGRGPKLISMENREEKIVFEAELLHFNFQSSKIDGEGNSLNLKLNCLDQPFPNMQQGQDSRVQNQRCHKSTIFGDRSRKRATVL